MNRREFLASAAAVGAASACPGSDCLAPAAGGLVGQETGSVTPYPPAVPIYPHDFSKLMWYQADLHKFPRQDQPARSGLPNGNGGTFGPFGDPWGTQSWSSTEQFLSWDVDVSDGGNYSVAVLYLCVDGSAGSQFEISAGASKVAGTTHETGNAWRKPGWDRQDVPGLLSLPAGRARVTMRILNRTGSEPEILQLRALEIVLPHVGKEMAERARKQHPNTDWMMEAKYGLMTHWTPFTQPRRGPKKPYCDAVRDFDVESYMQMIDETGAGYLVFPTGWGGFWFPGPINAISGRMPGRACERDLVMELADALIKRNRKLILYWGWWVPGTDYAQAWGQDLKEYARNFAAFLAEVGQRYGTKLAGFFFDGEHESRLYPNLYPYEMVTGAARTGNPNRVVSYNNWIFPRITDFQDYWIGESTHDLLPPPDASAFEPGGPQAGMQAHLNTFLDDFDWCHTKPNSEMLPPWHTTEEVVNYAKLCVQERTVPTINISIYQDGTVNPSTLDQMRAVRKAIRG
jgi:hypothetical protein